MAATASRPSGPQDHVGRDPATDERVRQHSAVARLAVAQGGDQQDGLTGDVVGEVLDHRQRLQVGPLQVLDDQRRRARRRRARRAGGARPRRASARTPPWRRCVSPHSGTSADSVGTNGATSTPGRTPNRAAPSSASLIGRSGAARGCRPADQHDPSLSDGPRSELTDQPALADACRSAHDAHRAAGAPRVAQTVDLAVSANEIARQHRARPAHVHHDPRLSQGRRALALGAAVVPVGFRAMARASAEDLRDALPCVEVPTLLVYGDHDVRAPLAVAEHLHAAITDSTLVVLADAGHVCNVEAADDFNTAVSQFLRQRLI